MMKPRHDPILVQATLQLARADAALVSIREHIDQSLNACTRSLWLLKRTVPVLRHAAQDRPGEEPPGGRLDPSLRIDASA